MRSFQKAWTLQNNGTKSIENKDPGDRKQIMSQENKITSIVDGPLHVTGQIELLDSDGVLLEKTEELYLCRCGNSRNKPYCDGQHETTGFRDDGKFVNPPAAQDDLDNTEVLEIKVQANGPLIFRGSACIEDTQGDKIVRKVGGLCRCQHSSNRPFCDGTHAKIGFAAK